MIINLICIVQFNTNSILTELYITIKYILLQLCAHMDILETIIFIHTYMSTHMYVCDRMMGMMKKTIRWVDCLEN